jgi:multidrug efflux pump
MLCARLLHSEKGRRHGRAYSWTEHAFEGLLRGYDRSLGWALRHWIVTLAILLVTIGLNWYLFTIVPKGFFPQQDNGMMFAGIQASQSTSFQAMRQILADDAAIIGADRPTRPACSSR